MLTDYERIKVERRERVLVVTIDRPEVLNAIDYETSMEMHAAWQEFAADPELRVGVLTGAGTKAFCAGADLKAHHQHGLANNLARPPVPFGGLIGNVEIWKPIVAAINGLALGGGLELAMACDLRVASAQAVFGLPEPRWGLVAARGGLVRLPRLIGMTRAMEMALTAQTITAQQALDYGLLNRVVAPEEVQESALALASSICALGPLAVQTSKEIIVRQQDLPLNQAEALLLERTQAIARTADAAEGLRAFAEKRKPAFTGR